MTNTWSVPQIFIFIASFLALARMLGGRGIFTKKFLLYSLLGAALVTGLTMFLPLPFWRYSGMTIVKGWPHNFIRQNFDGSYVNTNWAYAVADVGFFLAISLFIGGFVAFVKRVAT